MRNFIYYITIILYSNKFVDKFTILILGQIISFFLSFIPYFNLIPNLSIMLI